uniref:septal ring lytic transglycosylase RlpA family protein n=1 Tax=Pararhizobium sp. IMCC3301 TaxID=3067904 RepID=UPI002741322F|nr:septal ring lytic transglycosylase RlpA family protein [Pararhizobium sp. IMCC3301]
MPYRQINTDLFNKSRLLVIGALALSLSACGSSSSSRIDPKYGVAASPRVSKAAYIPSGGGRYQVGKPYKIAGRWYEPKEVNRYEKSGVASWYGDAFHGRRTANGEIYNMNSYSAAHPTLPLPSYVRVTNLANRNSVVVRVNDRGPFARDRLIDLSKRAADALNFRNQGLAKVHVSYLGKAPVEGGDAAFLAASVVIKGQPGPMRRRADATPDAPALMMAETGADTGPAGAAQVPIAYRDNRPIISGPGSGSGTGPALLWSGDRPTVGQSVASIQGFGPAQ